ncbi:ATP-binding protein [Streptomyces sp. NPDC005485]|uniref:ATP-binding protein n=1 Tax=Streptomyces sp. NPDC005485 TaxID=3155591 RepID=UPI0033B113B7
MKTTTDRTAPGHRNPTLLSSHMPLDHEPRAAPAARCHAATVLRAWGVPEDLVQDAVLVISELVTNASLHTRTGPLDLNLTTFDHELAISVTDACTSPVELWTPQNSSEREHGRGLDIVRSLAHAVGCSRTPTGKTVWARLSTGILRAS